MRKFQPRAAKLGLALSAVIAALATTAISAHVPRALAASRLTSPVDGVWNGFWMTYSKGSEGFVYEASMTLHSGAGETVSGQINWTLRRSGRTSEDAKVGRSALEFVRGNYDSHSKVLRLAGYDKTDPDGVIALDRYHLLLADNGAVIGGLTASGGSWQGSLMTFKSP